jgi:hypothetical protein
MCTCSLWKQSILSTRSQRIKAWLWRGVAGDRDEDEDEDEDGEGGCG